MKITGAGKYLTTNTGLQIRNIYSSKSDVLPRSTRKVFLPNPAKKKIEIIKSSPRAPTFEVKLGHRTNKLGIQMLSKSLYSKVFKEPKAHVINQELLSQVLNNLTKHNMKSKEEDYLKDVDFELPPLLGNSVEEHFKIIAEKQIKPYLDLVLELLGNAPKMPNEWLMQPGWTRYAPDEPPVQVPFPCEEGLVFDVEVCMMAGKAPTLATAMSSKAWYAWISDSLIEGTNKPVTSHQYNLDCLIPIESDKEDSGLKLSAFMKKPKVVIGHNVSYDRTRIKEQYWIERTGTRFIDTMSLHVCVGGLTSFQRAILKSGKVNEEDEEWKKYSSLNSLLEVHKLYCGTALKKDTREVFVEGTLSDIKEDFPKVMHYCASDVVATYNILKVLFPLFLERFPHPVTFGGMLELSTAYLPINSNWSRYVGECEQTFEDLETEAKILLARRADQACQLLYDENYKDDLWMWNEDWEVKETQTKKASNRKKSLNTTEEVVAKLKTENNAEDDEPDPMKDKFQYVYDTKDLLPARKTLLPGYPNWYRKLCTKPDKEVQWVPGANLISTSMQITPKLLSLTWEGYPLHFLKGKGWGFLVPYTTETDLHRKLPLHKLIEKCPVLNSKPKSSSGTEAIKNLSIDVQDNLMRREFYSRAKADKTDGLYKGTGIWCNTEIEECCWFFKLPHKNGVSYNVGNPLSKDFLNKFSDNVLAGDTESAERVLSIARMLSYWRNNRDRIRDQMVVWLDSQNLSKHLRDDGNLYGAIIPQVVVCGTLTRRAVEPTWMTASNAHPERVGSELRSMVQAPEGYNIVGADVDSQELWIASVLGDAHFAKMHGATPLGWMTLSGTKSDGTDMHSVTAKAVGISRDHAKVINYARIYGAGQNFAERLLKQFNPSMSDGEAKSKAMKMFSLTKGKRIFYLKKDYLQELPDQAYSKWQVFDIAKSFGKSIDEMFHKPKWVGGTESAMFNRLEEIANSPTPRTPFLNGRLSRALEPRSMKEDLFLPTRINWVVQSGAVDFLHLMLVCMNWIIGDKARFCLSFHDEIRYLVPETYKYRAALAMHVTNLLTRSFCSLKLGLNDLPQSVAFFSSVEVDTVLRKDSKQNCVTPSNPHGLDKGYGIPYGESLDIYEAVEKAGGNYTAWYNFERDVEGHKKKTCSDGNTSG